MILIDDLNIKENETLEQYKYRICSCKDSYAFTWNEVAEVINSHTGLNVTGDACRKYYSYHKTEQLNQMNEQGSNISEEYLNIQKERVKLRDERSQINSLVRTLAREETLKEIALEISSQMSLKKLLSPPSDKSIRSLEGLTNPEKSATLILSDWHYGLEVDVCYNTYNPEIVIDRLNLLLTRVISLCNNENISNLMILNLGDLISGNIHLPLRINSRYDVVSQTIYVSEILVEFIEKLCQTVPHISYASTTDNHSRIDSNKKDSLQTESFARFIDWYIINRLKDFQNFSFIPNTLGEDIASYKLYDHQIVGVHGDKDKQASIISNLTLYAQHHWDMVLSAHRHHFSADESNNTLFLCNGSLIGTDEYASSLRCNSKPSQLLIISTPEEVAHNIYKINLN